MEVETAVLFACRKHRRRLDTFQRLALIAQVRDRTDRHDSGRLMQRSEKGFWAPNCGVAYYRIPGISIPEICKGVRSCMLVIVAAVVVVVVVVVVAFVVLVVPSHIAS